MTKSDVISSALYLLAAIASGVAIAIGLWPSLLTIGALVGIVVGAVAVLGVAAPRWLRSKTLLHAVVVYGSFLLALEFVAIATWLASTKRRTAIVVVPEGQEVVRVIFNVADGAERHWTWSDRLYDVPAGGVLYSRFAPDDGWYRHTHRRPLEFRARRLDGTNVLIHGTWLATGFLEAGGCRFAFEEYAVGSVRTAGEGRSAWMDSLPSWGVVCREGHVVRGAPEGKELTELSAPDRKCWEAPGGGLTCHGGEYER